MSPYFKFTILFLIKQHLIFRLRFVYFVIFQIVVNAEEIIKCLQLHDFNAIITELKTGDIYGNKKCCNYCARRPRKNCDG